MIKNNKFLATKSPIVVMLTIFIIYYGVNYLLNTRTTCVLKSTLGIPCPSCGMTRSYVHLFHGEYKEALYDHPLFFMVPIIVITMFIYFRYKDNPTIRLILNRFFLVTSIVFILVYVARMVLYFPTTAPMQFNEYGVVPRIVKWVLQIFNT